MTEHEKKTMAAAYAYARETWNHEEEQFSCMDGFMAGTERAQREFTGSLWHDAGEEPDHGASCLGIYREFSEVVIFRYPITVSSWKDYVRTSSLGKWCYLEDIMPKEGGEG